MSLISDSYENLSCLRILWHGLRDFEILSCQHADFSPLSTSVWPTLRDLDDFAKTFRKTYDLIVDEARQIVNRPQDIDGWYGRTALCEPSDPEPLMCTPRTGREFFSAVIREEKLLSQYCIESNDIEASQSRNRLLELYITFSGRVDTVLVRLGLDVAIGSLIALPLHRAVRLNDVQILRSLLQHESPSQRDYLGRTALHVAVENNVLPMVIVPYCYHGNLLDLFQSDIFGRSPLNIGMHSSDAKLMKGIKLFATADTEPDDWGVVVLYRAVETGSLELTSLLLSAGADANKRSLHNEKPLLSFALEHGHQDIARVLIDAGADVNAIGKRFPKVTALHIAVKRGYHESVDRILCAGADVDGLAPGGLLPLQEAAKKGNLNIVDRLLKAGADIDAGANGSIFYRRKTALELAIEYCRTNVVHRLLEANADVNVGHPLAAAVDTKQIAVIKSLLDRNANVNVSHLNLDSELSSPLEVAALLGYVDVMQILLESGPKLDIIGYSLSVAAGQGQVKIVEILLAAGADPNAVGRDGNRALYEAVFSRRAETVSLLLRAGADPNSKDLKGFPLLFNAVKDRHSEIVRRLLLTGADPNPKDKYSVPVLLTAVQDADLETVHRLLLAGADVNYYSESVSTPYRMTALHSAVYYGHPEIVRVLLLAGADSHTTTTSDSDSEQNAMDIALSRGRPEIVQILRDTDQLASQVPSLKRKRVNAED